MSNLMTRSQIEEFINTSVTKELLESSTDSKVIANELISLLNDKLNNSEVDLRTVYTSRDMNNIRTYLIDKIKGLTDQWTDFNESDVGMVLLELIAGLGDMLGFYLDKQSEECYIGSVKQRKNGAAILSLIGYHMYMTNSCVTTCRFSLSEPLDNDVIIPKYTQLVAKHDGYSDILYATSEEKVLLAGTTSITVKCMQGEVHKSYVTIENLLNNQSVRLLANDIANNSMRVVIGNKTWTQVDDVLVIGDTPGRYYSVYEDKLCNPYVIFHNSYKTYLPSDKSSKAEFTYLTSLGPDGKVKQGAINTIQSDLVDTSGISVTDKLSVINIDDASGGSERESLDHAKVYAPKKLSTLGKAIVLHDYEDIANTIPGIKKCIALDWSVQNSKYVTVPYRVILYIVPTDGGVPSDTFLSSVTSYYSNIVPSSMTVLTRSAVYHKVDISADVYTVADESDYYRLKSLIISKLKDYLSNDNCEFGDGVQPSNISTLIENLDSSIDYVILHKPSDIISLDLNEFPVIGDINIEIKASSARKVSHSDLQA